MIKVKCVFFGRVYFIIIKTPVLSHSYQSVYWPHINRVNLAQVDNNIHDDL